MSTLTTMATSVVRASRPRAYVGVAGPDAEDYLQRMVSNDVRGRAVPALLLTPKSRLIAPRARVAAGPEDFLLLTEPGLGEVVRAHPPPLALRGEVRDRARGAHVGRRLRRGRGDARRDSRNVELLDARDRADGPTTSSSGCASRPARRPGARRSTTRSSRPRPGSTRRTISFTKGCYPGQEPVARLRHRGHVNRAAARARGRGGRAPGDEIVYEGKAVGRVTSAAPRAVALGYVRVEVPGRRGAQRRRRSARLH